MADTGRFTDIPTDRGERAARFWNQELLEAATHEEDWRRDSADIIKMMRLEDDRTKASRRSNMLWATNQVLAPGIYSQTPTPDVRRRYYQPGDQQAGQQDPAREAVEVLEKSIETLIDLEDFDETMEAARDDLLNVGRGVSWVVYRTDVTKHDVKLSADRVTFIGPDGDVVDPDAVEIENDKTFTLSKSNEELKPEYVIWTDYRESPARRESDVWWRARRHRFTKRQFKEHFANDADAAFAGEASSLASTPDDSGKENEPTKEPKSVLARKIIWEIWCKPTKQRLWLEANGHEMLKHRSALKGDAAPLQLHGFYPCPAPVYSVTTTDSRVPIPEYRMWEDDARDLDAYMTRAAAVMEVIKAVLLCDGAEMKKMPDIRDAADGTVIAVGRHNMAAQNLRNSLVEWPIDKLVQVLVSLQEMIDAKKATIFEKTGVSDLARGMTDPDETASAQRLKGAFGQYRMAPRSKPFQRHVRDVLRIMAEIVSEQFDRETLQMMTGMEISDEAFELLRNDRARSMRIDIETDSTISPDAEQMQRQAVQFMEVQSNFLQGLIPVAQAVKPLVPYLAETLKASLRPFKFGRQAEDALEDALEQLKQMAQQPEQEPQPEPKDVLKAQTDQARLQLDAQAMSAQDQRERMKIAADILQSDTERDDQLLNAEADRDMQREQMERQRAQEGNGNANRGS